MTPTTVTALQRVSPDLTVRRRKLDFTSSTTARPRTAVLDAPRVIRLSPQERVAHLLTVLPITSAPAAGSPVNATRTVVDFRVYNEASGWLAFTHLNDPSLHILSGLRQRLDKCDFKFTLDMRDDQFSPMHSARTVYSIFSGSTLLPIGMVGAARSAVSTSISLLNLVYRMTQISSSSTSSSLDNKVIHPFFARTIPTNAGDARAIGLYLKNLGVTHVAVLHYSDDYATQYHLSFLREAEICNITVFSVQYRDRIGGDVAAITQLANSRIRYIVAIFGSNTWRPMVTLAAQQRIMGVPGYTWLVSDSASEIANPSFALNRTTDGNILATALNGVGLVSLNVPKYKPFDTLLQQFQTNRTMQQKYVNQHHDPTIFDGYAFPPTGMSLFQYLTYDAMIALGVAACEVPNDIFSGADLHQQLLKTTFEGVSGFVSFNNITGTRQSDSFVYQIQNVLLSDNRSTTGQIQFVASTAALVDAMNSSSPVQVLLPFVYTDNTTMLPLPLPPLTIDMNLIPVGARAFGLSLGGLVMISSLGWLAWTLWQRNKDVVRASQPLFLGQLCIGTFILSLAVVPMSLQEPVSQRVLDVACMSSPWLVSIGFVTCFSALFSKTWRLNKLFLSGNTFRRVMVRSQDVMLPFFALTAFNFTVLSLWTTFAPMHWQRSPKNDVDQFGRTTASYGRCTIGGNPLAAVLTALIFLVDFLAIAFANFQAYKARNLPTDFNESFYIAVSMAFLTEIILLGLPLTLVASENPTTTFVIRCMLVSLSSLAIQLPVFLPKFIQRHHTYKKIQLQRPGRSSVAMIRMAASASHSMMNQSQHEGAGVSTDADRSNSHLDRTQIPSGSMGRMRVMRSHSYTSSGSHSSVTASPTRRLIKLSSNFASINHPNLKRHTSNPSSLSRTLVIPEHLPLSSDEPGSSDGEPGTSDGNDSFANASSDSANSKLLKNPVASSEACDSEDNIALNIEASIKSGGRTTFIEDSIMKGRADGISSEDYMLDRSHAALSSSIGDLNIQAKYDTEDSAVDMQLGPNGDMLLVGLLTEGASDLSAVVLESEAQLKLAILNSSEAELVMPSENVRVFVDPNNVDDVDDEDPTDEELALRLRRYITSSSKYP